MKKEIYKLFTLENGVVMTMPVLSHLSKCIKDAESLWSFFSCFKSRFNTSTIDLGQIEQILTRAPEERDVYVTKVFQYAQRNLSGEFERLRAQIGAVVTPISLLEDGVESLIFGVFYRDRTGMLVLEDDHDVMELCLDGVLNDAFVFENMFVGIRGVKKERFNACEIVLPAFTVNSSENNFLDKSRVKICVFGCLGEQVEFLRSVLDIERPSIAIVSTDKHVDLGGLEELGTKLAICSCKCDGSFLPSQLKGISNPFIMELHGTKVGFLDHELFKERQDGIFLNRNPVDSFLRSLLSQSSLNPFAGSDMSVSEFPNVYVISQDACPLVLDVGGVKFVSLPPVSEGAYAVLDFLDGRFEVVYR